MQTRMDNGTQVDWCYSLLRHVQAMKTHHQKIESAQLRWLQWRWSIDNEEAKHQQLIPKHHTHLS
jgi:hypothetical protein